VFSAQLELRYFRRAGNGPLIGHATWGALAAIYGLKGDWEAEHHGIAPEVEVEMDPAPANGRPIS
jgi:hypothetical protein